MENHNFSWEKPLFLWPFSSSLFVNVYQAAGSSQVTGRWSQQGDDLFSDGPVPTKPWVFWLGISHSDCNWDHWFMMIYGFFFIGSGNFTLRLYLGPLMQLGCLYNRVMGWNPQKKQSEHDLVDALVSGIYRKTFVFVIIELLNLCWMPRMETYIVPVRFCQQKLEIQHEATHGDENKFDCLHTNFSWLIFFWCLTHHHILFANHYRTYRDYNAFSAHFNGLDLYWIHQSRKWSKGIFSEIRISALKAMILNVSLPLTNMNKPIHHIWL